MEQHTEESLPGPPSDLGHGVEQSLEDYLPRPPSKIGLRDEEPAIDPDEKRTTSRGHVKAMRMSGAGEGQIDFLKDLPGHMTWGRRIALYLSRNFTWYNPLLGQEKGPDGEELPSIEKAWAYFEHVTLDRFVVDSGYRRAAELTTFERVVSCFHKGDRRMNLAEPGEKNLPTKLYNPLTTPLSQLGDFGLGYGIYFSTLRQFSILGLLAFFLNLPNILYFASDDYSSGQPDIAYLLQGSAICTDREWVACPDCEESDFDSRGAYHKVRYIFTDRSEPDTTGDYLNITEYVHLDEFDYGVDDDILYESDTVFRSDTFQRLEDDFGIQFTDYQIVIEGHDNIDCTYFEDCVWEHTVCQVNAPNDCYLYVGPGVTFADTDYTKYGFAVKNQCDGATLQQGFINLGTVLLFIAGAIAIRRRQDALEVQFDEDEQTAQDYSIAILNPPSDAYDPSEWKSFFEDNFGAKVTVCTVDVDNDRIIQLLVQRRLTLQRLELLLPGIPLTMENLEEESEKALRSDGGLLRRIGLGSDGVPEFLDALKETNTELVNLLSTEKRLPVSSVFVTFETETGQREVLEWLTVGNLAAHRNDTSCVDDPRHLFRGKHVLEVVEPEEPSSIRWQEMNVSQFQIVTKLVWTTFLTVFLIAVGSTIILLLYPRYAFVATLVTTVFTSVFPMFAKNLMSREHHRTESSRQKWLFIKISLFNIFVTSVLISIANPFTASLDDKEGSLPGLIPSVYALFFSQLGLTPFLQLTDIAGNINRHLIAPRQKTQGEMNRQFQGAEIYLAERYANLMKYLFLMVWYCVLFPASFLMGFAALFIVYFADRFSLMRSWARTPQLGTQISDFARNYFTPAALAFMVVLSAYAWSGFPYDNLCIDEGAELHPIYLGNWSIDIPGPETKLFGLSLFKEPDVLQEFVIEPDSPVYRYCLQDFRAYIGDRSFPPLPKFQYHEWMTSDQEQLLDVYGWVAVGILAGVCLSFLLRIGYNVFRAINGIYSPRGDDMGINYSDLPTIDSYVPQYQPSFGYPLLLCPIRDIDEHLFSWTDPDRPHSYYDVTHDVKEVMKGTAVQVAHAFASVKHWPHGTKKR